MEKDTTQTQQRGLTQRTEAILVKRENLFIHKEGENYETPSDEVVALSVLFILADNPWAIQAINIFFDNPTMYLTIDG